MKNLILVTIFLSSSAFADAKAENPFNSFIGEYRVVSCKLEVENVQVSSSACDVAEVRVQILESKMYITEVWPTGGSVGRPIYESQDEYRKVTISGTPNLYAAWSSDFSWNRPGNPTEEHLTLSLFRKGNQVALVSKERVIDSFGRPYRSARYFVLEGK